MVRTGLGSYGKGPILHLFSAETTASLDTKFILRMLTSVRGRELLNLEAIGFTEAAPHVGELYSYRFSVSFLDFFLLLLFLVPSTHLKTAIRNGFGRLVAQKTWFGARICLLSVRIATITSKGFKIYKSFSSR